MKLLVINGSVRESRATTRVVAWVENVARETQQDVEFSSIDLKVLNLPMFNEPVLPMMNPDRATEGSLKAWLDALDGADGYVFVTPEYNHGIPSGLKNAIDYINFQVMKKPFTIVSHGVNGGARAAEQLKLVLNANIGAVPVPAVVTLNGMIGYGNMISEAGEVQADSLEGHQKSLLNALETVKWYAEALKVKRETKVQELAVA